MSDAHPLRQWGRGGTWHWWGVGLPRRLYVALVENVILQLHRLQMKALGFLGATGIYCSNNK